MVGKGFVERIRSLIDDQTGSRDLLVDLVPSISVRLLRTTVEKKEIPAFRHQNSCCISQVLLYGVSFGL